MRLPTLQPAEFLDRPNRFVARVRLGRRTALTHVPNTGRMAELLVEGRPVWVAPVARSDARRTRFDLVLVGLGQTLVSVDSRLPPKLIEESIGARGLAAFRGYLEVRLEQTYGRSRIDLLASGPGGECYIEAKSCNRVEGGVALFPDAVTARGARHLRELAAAAGAGWRAAVVFVVQREDASSFAPDPTDPAFAHAFQEARAAGVEAYAFPCRVTVEEIRLQDRPLPLNI